MSPVSPTVSPAFPLCPWQLHVTVLVLPPLPPVPVLLSWSTASSVPLFCFPMSLSCPLWAPATPASPSHALCLHPVLVDPSHPCPILSPMPPSHPRVPVPSCMDPILSPVSPVLSPVDPSHSHVPVPSPVGPILSPMSLSHPPQSSHPRVALPSPVDPIDPLSRSSSVTLGPSHPHVPNPVPVVTPGVTYPPPWDCRVPAPSLTVEELRAFLEQMNQLPCVMHQIGEVQVSRGGPSISPHLL